MTTLTKIPKHVEFELDLRSLLEGLAERGRLCDSAVEQEADAALSLLRRMGAIGFRPKSGKQQAREAILIQKNSSDLMPENEEEAL